MTYHNAISKNVICICEFLNLQIQLEYNEVTNVTSNDKLGFTYLSSSACIAVESSQSVMQTISFDFSTISPPFPTVGIDLMFTVQSFTSKYGVMAVISGMFTINKRLSRLKYQKNIHM